MAHKKGQGSTQNNRDSIGRRLGVASVASLLELEISSSAKEELQLMQVTM